MCHSSLNSKFIRYNCQFDMSKKKFSTLNNFLYKIIQNKTATENKSLSGQTVIILLPAPVSTGFLLSLE